MEENINVSEKRKRFIKIAEKRVNYILQNLNNLGNCANKRNYEYGDEDVRKIFSEIDKRVREIKLKFSSKSDGRSNFKLHL